MWGNTLGWRISSVLFIIAISVAFWLRAQMQITAPTSLSLNDKNLAELSPPLGPETIVAQDQPGDAAGNYSSAAQMYQDDPDASDEYAQKPEGALPAPLQLVLDATRLSTMNLFAKTPTGEVDYQSDHPQLDNLSKLGQNLEAAALRLNRAGKNDQARSFLLAAYALGKNLFQERVDYDEYSHGLGLMNGALTGLSDLEPENSPKSKALQDQASAMVDFDHQDVQPLYEVLASIDPAKVAANAGDVFRFAARARERMFRVEAILKLGRYRFDAARAADQLAAPRFLRSFGNDPDPVIRTAAQAAANLTLEQYRMIH
jgi:hypothetical protein